jgi:hypothetical protein
MKIFFSLMISCFLALSSFAQYNSVILKVNGNKNRKVVLDGRTYTMTNANAKANNKNITITDLQPGQHTIQVLRTNKSTSTTTTTFMIKNGYDVTITVNGTGAVQVREKLRTVASTTGVQQPMTAATYNALILDIKNQWQAGAKLNMIGSAFANTGNYFSTLQAAQLIQLVDAEGSRLQLAKASYRSITDRNNFNNIYSLLSEQASRNELSVYVNNYNNTSTTSTSAGMNTTVFNNLVQDIQNQWQAGAKQTMIANAFANTNNTFTTVQARQLIQLVDTEDSRLQLAKASYRSITDPANFNNIFSLLSAQWARDELTTYVSQYTTNNPPVRAAMSASAFTSLLQGVQNQWQAASRFNMINNAFNGTGYFTASQVRQLVQTVDAESSRLQLAKSAYKMVTDAANYSIVSELLETQASRNDLAAYIRNGGEVTPVDVTAKVTMSDAGFQAIIDNIRSQWMPGSKMLALQEVFANNSNYFSTAQVKQLVAFVTVEANRLQLLKASYRTVTDRPNFSATYDLLATQAGRDDLANYVRTFAG